MISQLSPKEEDIMLEEAREENYEDKMRDNIVPDEDLIPAHRCPKCGTLCCRGEFFKNDCVFCGTESIENIEKEVI